MPSDPVVSEKTASKTEEPDLAFLRYDTGDVTNWPDYRFPLHHSFDTPDVPPEIIGPFTADDIPIEE